MSVAARAQVTCVYLFHELPGEVRRAVAAEMMRVLRPGGLVVLVDSIQARPARLAQAMLRTSPWRPVLHSGPG